MIVNKTNIKQHTATFETQRQWLQQEYTAAKAAKPKNDMRIYELENRTKQWEREVRQFNEKKKKLGL